MGLIWNKYKKTSAITLNSWLESIKVHFGLATCKSVLYMYTAQCSQWRRNVFMTENRRRVYDMSANNDFNQWNKLILRHRHAIQAGGVHKLICISPVHKLTRMPIRKHVNTPIIEYQTYDTLYSSIKPTKDLLQIIKIKEHKGDTSPVLCHWRYTRTCSLRNCK